MTDLLKIMFGTAALLFGWTLLEELPKNPPPPKETQTQTFGSTNQFGNPLPPNYVGQQQLPPLQNYRQAYQFTPPPPNQFDLERRIAGPRIYQH